jgi:DNA-directed RNA polymerase specialized sigma subunit
VCWAGLIDVIQKYDPTRGAKFKTYAEFRVRGAILDELRSMVSLYYEELTMKEIGGVLSITESRVSQIHSKAVFRLRTKLKAIIAEEL